MCVKDVIHGEIKLNEIELKLLDTSLMKSLSGKMDIGNINLVYPGARHTRLEHSLGTMYMANEICSTLLEKGYEVSDEVKIVRLSALLHDVGHGSGAKPPRSVNLSLTVQRSSSTKKLASHTKRQAEK